MLEFINGHTKTYALLGSPVGHSGSPQMYNYCFKKLQINSVYVALDVDLEHLPDAMAGVKAMGFSGLNITMPCKSAVMHYLDEVSPAATLMNACNVAVNQGGRWVGHNTDGIGYVENLKAHGVEVCGKAVTILGAGGAGTAIAVQCALSGVRELFIFNLKDPFFSRAQEMACRIMQAVPNCKVSVHDLEDTKALSLACQSSDILANATRSGMAPDVDEMPIPSVQLLHPKMVVTDTVYNPRQTRLLQQAQTVGCKTIQGTGMLIQQGAAAFRLFTGAEMPVKEVHELVFGK